MSEAVKAMVSAIGSLEKLVLVSTAGKVFRRELNRKLSKTAISSPQKKYSKMLDHLFAADLSNMNGFTSELDERISFSLAGKVGKLCTGGGGMTRN